MKKILLLFVIAFTGLITYGQKVSDLTEATSMGNTDLFMIVQSSTSKKLTKLNLLGGYALVTSVNLKLTITDTTAMLVPYIIRGDTASMLTNYITTAETAASYQTTLTNSAGLRGALSDETGTGLSVFATSPTFTTGITIGSNTILEAQAGYLDFTSSGQTQMETKAALSSPTFTNVPLSTTAAQGTNTTQIATTAFVQTEIAAGTEIGTVALLLNPTITAKNASFDLTQADNGTWITMDNAGATNIGVPLNATTAIEVGFQVNIFCIGAGVSTIVPEGGVTIISNGSLLDIIAEGECYLAKIATNIWKLGGTLE